MSPLKYGLHDVPHLVIEPNLTCNMQCRNCYVTQRGHVKTLDEIRAEIDLGLRKRKAETISLLGGEPTLHPDLPAVIRYVKQRGLTCQVLTNGTMLEQRPALLRDMVSAGLDRIVLHADAGQGRCDAELDRFIEAMFDRFDAAGIFFSLALTVYPDNRRAIPILAHRYARYQHFDGILATLAIDTAAASKPTPRRADAATLLDEHRAIAFELGVEPTTYVPSNLDDASPRWLVYFYFLNAATGRAFAVSPRIDRVYRSVLRVLRGRYIFGAPVRLAGQLPLIAATLVLETALEPARLLEAIRLLALSRWLTSMRLHYLVLQSGPEFNERRNAVELCYHCPDATVRNGLLTPVCLADIINPLQTAGGAPRAIDDALKRSVYAHLGET
jgi:hypothetical protein